MGLQGGSPVKTVSRHCIFCGEPTETGDHHLVAKTLHSIIPNLTEEETKVIDDVRVPVCSTHHEIVEEMARVYGNIIRCLIERRPYNLKEGLPYRKEQIMKRVPQQKERSQ